MCCKILVSGDMVVVGLDKRLDFDREGMLMLSMLKKKEVGYSHVEEMRDTM